MFVVSTMFRRSLVPFVVSNMSDSFLCEDEPTRSKGIDIHFVKDESVCMRTSRWFCAHVLSENRLLWRFVQARKEARGPSSQRVLVRHLGIPLWKNTAVVLFFDTPAMENLKFKVQQVKYLGEQAEYRPRRLENLIFVLWPGTTGTSQVVLGFPDAFILVPYFTTA